MTSEQPRLGSIVWTDLTVPDAPGLRDFYAGVTGWTPEPVDMGDHEDFTMLDSEAQAAAGICHALGANADLPPQWLVYIAVDDLDAAMARCTELGGAVISGPKGSAEDGRYCVIRDPAGAVAALIDLPA